MGKLLKWLVKLVVLIVALVLVAVVVLPFVVDPNDFKDEIAAQVKQATGRELVIEGDIGLSVFPWLGLELGALQLSNAAGFGEEPFAAVQGAQVRVKLMPLLKKRLEADTVTLDGLSLNLSKAKDGATNWDDLAGAPAAEEAQAAKPAAPSEGPPLAALAIGGVMVRDARVVWDDQSAGQRYVVDGLNLETGEVVPGRPVELELGFDVSSTEPPLAGRVELEGTIDVDESLTKVAVAPMELRLVGLKAADLTSEVTLLASLSADMVAETYRLSDLDLKADLAGESLPGGKLSAGLVGNVIADLASQTLDVSGLKLVSAPLEVSGGIQGEKILDAPRFTGALSVAEFSPRQLMETFRMDVPETADPEVLKRLALRLDLDATPDRASLGNLKASLDDTTLSGRLSVANFAKPAIRFNLDVDAIDVDRYLPPPAEGETRAAAPAPAASGTAVPAPAASPAASAEAGGELLPVETLRALNLDGVFRIGRIKVAGLNADEVELTVKGKDGKLNLDQKVGKLYDGSYAGRAVIDARGKTPRLSTENHLASIEAGPLLQDLTGKDSLTGKGRFNAKLNASGNTEAALRKTLAGNLDFDFRDGAVKGFNLAQTIRETRAKFNGEPPPPADENNQTDFSELSGSALVTNGVLVNEDLKAKSPLLRVDGKGKADLVQENLDYTVTTVLVGSLEGQGGQGLEDLKGVHIPVKAKGPFADLSYGVDWGGVMQGVAKAKAQEKIDEKKEEVTQKLQEKLGDELGGSVGEALKGGLEGLFGR